MILFELKKLVIEDGICEKCLYVAKQKETKLLLSKLFLRTNQSFYETGC